MATTNLEPANETERQVAALFAHHVAGLGAMEVLVLGAHDDAYLADALAASGARVTCVDADAARVLAGREASKRRRAALGAAASKRVPAINQVATGALRDKFGVQSFDAVLSYLEPARMAELEPLFSALYFLLRTDGMAALAIPHPCFQGGIASYFDVADLPGEHGRLPGPVFHRPLTVWVDAAAEAGFQLRGLAEAPGPDGGALRAAVVLEFAKDKWAP